MIKQDPGGHPPFRQGPRWFAPSLLEAEKFHEVDVTPRKKRSSCPSLRCRWN